MKKKIVFVISLILMFILALALCVASAESDAEEIRDSVFRFHVIANSDSEQDQTVKLKLRDGIASYCSELFEYAPDKQTAQRLAKENMDNITDTANSILKKIGSEKQATVTVRKRFFPTRHYDGVSLPAGVYDTLDIIIGEGKGKNFWCVMFPDICLNNSTVAQNRDKMTDVLTGDPLQMTLDSSDPGVQFKFKTVEIFESIKNFLFK